MLRAYHAGCQACGSGEDLQVHHRHYDTLGNEAPRDLVLLCDACHEATHKFEWPAEEIDELAASNPMGWHTLSQQLITNRGSA